MIFVDSSFWIATRLPADRHHESAARLMRLHGENALVTTNHVMGETWTFLRRKVSHRSAIDFLDRVERTKRLRVIRVSLPDESAAWRWLRRHDERRYSFVDATSFVVMKANKIRQALAFDGDFAAAGFVELRP